jgi:hypothetical protein
VGGAFSTHGRWKKCVQEFDAKTPEGRRPLWGLARGVDWIQLAQDRDRWLAVVNTVMNLRVLAPRS